MSIHDLLDRMESAEDDFLKTEFLAPVLPGGQVRVRIEGLVCTLRVTGQADPGWAILKPVSMERARVVAEPSLRQLRDYLALFPAVRMLLLARAGDYWLAVPAHRGDRRIQIEGQARVHLATGVEPFQQVVTRFDGSVFLFQEVDRRRSPAIAAYLRDELNAGTQVGDLHKATLTAEERDVYQLAREAIDAARQAAEAARRDRAEVRLADALAHAGAELASYIEQADAYAVSYTVDGSTHRSIVRKDDLTVLTAGICLEGGDRDFDLQSLVGVLREETSGRRLRGG
ncbi:MAG: hypothetical protein JXA93_03520 [Anaerolineae bacterium]|nr:hypothetical protein [Anaerolineae bacterium]